jgi:excisionase family DNA binding protein
MATIEQPLIEPNLTVEEAQMVRTAQRCIMEALDHSRAAAITLVAEDGSTPSIDVPPQALRFIAQLLGMLSERQPIALLPVKHELSTVEAAAFLNVSRPFVIKEIEEGRLHHRMVGTHRRIEFEELQRYQRDMKAKQSAALQRMADDARDHGLEY